MMTLSPEVPEISLKEQVGINSHPPLRHMTCKKKHIRKVASALSMEDVAAAVTSDASTFHPDISPNTSSSSSSRS